MSAADIARGVAEGWLMPEEDGWHRFVWDFEQDAITGAVTRVPARSIKRVRARPDLPGVPAVAGQILDEAVRK